MVHVDQGDSLVLYPMDRCKEYNIEDVFGPIMTDQDNAAEIALWDDRRTRLYDKVHENDFCAIPGNEWDTGDRSVVHVIKFSDLRSKKKLILSNQNKKENGLKPRNKWIKVEVSALPED